MTFKLIYCHISSVYYVQVSRFQTCALTERVHLRQMLCFRVANGNHCGVSDELIESKMLTPMILLSLLGTFKFNFIVSFNKPVL